jgi:hypothetical protein
MCAKRRGAELCIAPESQQPKSGDCVYRGGTEAARRAGLQVPAKTPNAFVIKLAGNALSILGDDFDGPAKQRGVAPVGGPASRRTNRAWHQAGNGPGWCVLVPAAS